MKRLFYLPILIALLVACHPKPDHLTVLHTNDTHSQVEPTAVNDGGYARRMGVIQAERAADPQLLLVDAGDFCQGTPYFNFYRGRVEIDAMNRMGYDAATLGNHEFDNGLDTLAMILRMAHFPIVCANYDVEGTPLEGIVQDYCIAYKNGLKIGIFGLGVDPSGLIGDKNFGGIKFLDPYETARKMIKVLRRKRCDLIICLSHMGTYRLDEERAVSDALLASQVKGIDLIIGGHTHVVYDIKIPNPEGAEVPIRQMGKSGRFIGKIRLNLQ